MIPSNEERLRGLNEKMLDWICEHINDDQELFNALYSRIGLAQSELDPEIECRIYKMYQGLPSKERLAVKVKAEYGEFLSHWHRLTQYELIEQAEKISIVKSVYHELLENITDEQAEYFVMFCEPLEAISEKVLELNHERDWSPISQIMDVMFEEADGGAFFDMEEEYYEDRTQQQ